MLNNCEAKGLGCVLTLPIYRGREQHGNGREAGDKGTGSGRVRYGRREVLTPLSPPTCVSWLLPRRVCIVLRKQKHIEQITERCLIAPKKFSFKERAERDSKIGARDVNVFMLTLSSIFCSKCVSFCF